MDDEHRLRSTLEAVESRGRASAALANRPPAPFSAAPTLSQLRLLGFSFLNSGLGNSGMVLLSGSSFFFFEVWQRVEQPDVGWAPRIVFYNHVFQSRRCIASKAG